MLKIGVFASGAGSNFIAIHEAAMSGRLSAEIRLVVSNNSSAGALEYARGTGIPALHLSSKTVADETALPRAFLSALAEHDVDFVVLAGYMKLMPREVIAAYPRRITNIHPALLPKFGGKGMFGMHVHEAVLASGDAVSGATVHLVDEVFDHGAIILQRTVPVMPGDTPQTLAARVLEVEHAIYPEALQLFAGDRLHFDGSHVTILDTAHQT